MIMGMTTDAPERIWAWPKGAKTFVAFSGEPRKHENPTEYVRADIAHAAGYAQGVTDAASACNNIRCEYAESHQSSMAFAAMVCCDVVAALSPRGQDHAPEPAFTVGGA